MHRRDLFRAVGATGLAAAAPASLLSTTSCSPPPNPADVDALFDLIWPAPERRRPDRVEPSNPTAPPRLPAGTTRTALVIGGGLAGLSAALELVDAGYQVTVRDADTVLGGRLATRQLDPGLGRTFAVEHGLHMWFDNYWVFKDIRRRLDLEHNFRPVSSVYFRFDPPYQDELLESKPHVFPFNLLRLVDVSPNLDTSDVIASLGIFEDVLRFRMDGLYDRLDDISFFDWMQRTGVSPKFRDIFLQPAAHVTLNRESELSAAEMVLYQHLYFISQPFAFERTMTTTDHATAVIDPWVAHLRDGGAAVQTGAPVPGLRISNGRAIGVVGEATDYDWVVMATDVVGTRAIARGSVATDAASGAALARLQTRLGALQVAPPYRILRCWFDRQLPATIPDVIETPKFGPIALIGQFHQLESEGAAWAATTGGSILEFHLYAMSDELAAVPDEAVWATIRPTALRVLPALAPARLLGQTIGNYENFSSFSVGSGRNRPTPTSPASDGISNLRLCGDWVHADVPSALMERAVLTGRLAANACRLADGVREVGYDHTALTGPMA